MTEAAHRTLLVSALRDGARSGRLRGRSPGARSMGDA
jgi:hypothetical protein